MNISSFSPFINTHSVSKTSFGAAVRGKQAERNGEDKFVSKNLYRFLKKSLHQIDEINEFLANLSDDEKYVGSLPESWRNKFTPEELKEKTLEVEKIFSDFAAKSHKSKWVDFEEFLPEEEELGKRLSDVLNEECKVTPVGKGMYGRVFRVRTKDEDLALKIFHCDNDSGRQHAHGQTKELANAIYLCDTLKPNQCAKFYFGKVTAHGENDGFMVTKFIKTDKSKQEPLYEKPDSWKYRRFHNGDGDTPGNVINGAITDFGAISYEYNGVFQQDLAKKLFPLMRNGDVKGITDMRTEYDENPDFENLKHKKTHFLQRKIDGLYAFLIELTGGRYSKKEIEAYRALGVDFSRIDDADSTGFEIPPDVMAAMNEYGFTPKTSK